MDGKTEREMGYPLQEQIAKADQTATELLKSTERAEPIPSTVLNIQLLFAIMEKRPPRQREAIRNFILGCASQAIAADKWKEILEMAIKSAEDSEGRII